MNQSVVIVPSQTVLKLEMLVALATIRRDVKKHLQPIASAYDSHALIGVLPHRQQPRYLRSEDLVTGLEEQVRDRHGVQEG